MQQHPDDLESGERFHSLLGEAGVFGASLPIRPSSYRLLIGTTSLIGFGNHGDDRSVRELISCKRHLQLRRRFGGPALRRPRFLSRDEEKTMTGEKKKKKWPHIPALQLVNKTRSNTGTAKTYRCAVTPRLELNQRLSEQNLHCGETDSAALSDSESIPFSCCLE